jgi:hypothetical protein
MKFRKSKPGDENLVSDESADPADRSGAIARLAVDHRREFEPQFVRLLDHTEELLRLEAIKALVVFFRLDEYLPMAVKMLARDPSEFVRSSAAFALGAYAFAERREEEMILRALAGAIQRDSSTLVVYTAYRNLLRILDPDATTSHLTTEIDRDRDVDWDLLRPYLPN